MTAEMCSAGPLAPYGNIWRYSHNDEYNRLQFEQIVWDDDAPDSYAGYESQRGSKLAGGSYGFTVHEPSRSRNPKGLVP